MKYVIFPSIFPFRPQNKKKIKGENVTPCKEMSTRGSLEFATEIPSAGLCVKGSVWYS